MVRFLVSALLVLSACADRLPESESDALTTSLAGGSSEASGADAPVTGDVLGLLAFLNAPTTTRDLLDFEVGLDSRSANNLVAHRDGRDGRFPSADDDVFETLAEVDGVEWVGEATLAKLFDWVEASGTESLAGTFDDVTFTEHEAEATLAWVNASTLDFLDVDFGLDVRAARSIIDAQPIASIDELAAQPYVGEATLRDLRDAAVAPPAFGSTTTSLRSDDLWTVDAIEHHTAPVTLHWQEAVQVVQAAQVLGLPVENAADLYPLVDDGVMLDQISGAPSPFVYDWFQFHREGRELGAVFVSGTVEPVALVVDGAIVTTW